MRISEQTKIAVLLRHHPDALERIVALSPDFKKLRNPVLRKLMAGRTTIAMAAKIGGCTPQDFFHALDGPGFEPEELPAPESAVAAQDKLPDFLQHLPAEQLVQLDVRTMLAAGGDPLALIQRTVKELQPGQVLQIINTFEPVPLIRLLERQGFGVYVKAAASDRIETFFFREGAAAPAPPPAVSPQQDGWDELLRHFAGRLQSIDVRHLEMPQPMMSILEALESLPAGEALYVRHKRIPVFLLTELKERDFDYRIKEVAQGEVYLLIFKKGS
jgi:uncharacterized protein (DUF2249 family)